MIKYLGAAEFCCHSVFVNNLCCVLKSDQCSKKDFSGWQYLIEEHILSRLFILYREKLARNSSLNSQTSTALRASSLNKLFALDQKIE